MEISGDPGEKHPFVGKCFGTEQALQLPDAHSNDTVLHGNDLSQFCAIPRISRMDQ